LVPTAAIVWYRPSRNREPLAANGHQQQFLLVRSQSFGGEKQLYVMGSKQLGKISLCLLASAGFLLLGQDWRHQRDTFFHGDRWHGHVFAQVRDDLNHIYTAGAAKDKERQRIMRTEDELTALQAKADQGVWDNGTVNDVIDSLRKSANDDRLGPQDRQILADDAERVHDFQRNHNQWLRH
jgi:hypothetical protein